MFLLSYTNTRESLGELKKAAETLACGLCSHSISRARSPKLPLMFYITREKHPTCFLFLNYEFCNADSYLGILYSPGPITLRAVSCGPPLICL